MGAEFPPTEASCIALGTSLPAHGFYLPASLGPGEPLLLAIALCSPPVYGATMQYLVCRGGQDSYRRWGKGCAGGSWEWGVLGGQ